MKASRENLITTSIEYIKYMVFYEVLTCLII